MSERHATDAWAWVVLIALVGIDLVAGLALLIALGISPWFMFHTARTLLVAGALVGGGATFLWKQGLPDPDPSSRAVYAIGGAAISALVALLALDAVSYMLLAAAFGGDPS
jgi:hypothetical protein